jgi:hypothetical protein
MFVRRLDVLGYARLKHWRIYGEEGLARCEVAVWLGDDGLVVEYGGETLSRYDVSFSPGAPRLDAVTDERQAVRHEAPLPSAQALRARRNARRHGLAEGPRAGRVRAPVAEQARDATGSAVLLSGSPVAPRRPNFAVAIELPGGKARRHRLLLKSWCGSGGKPCRWRNAVRPAVRASGGHRWGGTVCRLPP